MNRRTSSPRISAHFPLRIINVSSAPGLPLLQACAAVGIVLRRAPRTARRTSPRAATQARRLLRGLASARLVLITGPSGGGKSTLLRELLRCSRRAGERPVMLQDTSSRAAVPIIQRLQGSTARRLAILARAGLADATLFPRSAQELSEGQRYRFRLALAMDRASRRASRTLFADEFASTLDRTTARALCHTLSRWIRTSPAPRTIILATAHDDVAAWLRPDVVIRCALDGSWSAQTAPASVPDRARATRRGPAPATERPRPARRVQPPRDGPDLPCDQPASPPRADSRSELPAPRAVRPVR